MNCAVEEGVAALLHDDLGGGVSEVRPEEGIGPDLIQLLLPISGGVEARRGSAFVRPSRGPVWKTKRADEATDDSRVGMIFAMTRVAIARS